MLRQALLFILCWTPLDSFGDFESNSRKSNSHDFGGAIVFDDDYFPTVLTQIQLGTFSLRIKPTISSLDSSDLNELIDYLELKITDYLEIKMGIDVELVQISRFPIQIDDEIIAASQVRGGNNRIRFLIQDDVKSRDNRRKLIQNVYTTELYIEEGITISFYRDRHKKEIDHLSSEKLMNRIKTSVDLNNEDEAIFIGDHVIEEILLFWKDTSTHMATQSASTQAPSQIYSETPNQIPIIESVDLTRNKNSTHISAPEKIPNHQSKDASYVPLVAVFVGLGAFTFFGGGLFFLVKRRRNRGVKDGNSENNTPLGCVSELQGLQFLRESNNNYAMNIQFDEGKNEVEISPASQREVHVPAIFLKPESSCSSDITMLSDDFSKKIDDVEYAWMRDGVPPTAQYNTDEHKHEHVQQKFPSHLNLNRYSSENSLSHLVYSSNTSLVLNSVSNSEGSRSSKDGFEPDTTWDPNDNEVESNNEEIFAPSKLNGRVLKALDINMPNPRDSFTGHKCKWREEDLSTDEGLPSIA